jgi:hypothetical protein
MGTIDLIRSIAYWVPLLN